MEGLLGLLGRTVGGLLPRDGVQVPDGDDHVVLVEGEILLDDAAEHQALALVHEAVDGDGALLACRDGVDGEPRSGDDVAAGEDVGLA